MRAFGPNHYVTSRDRQRSWLLTDASSRFAAHVAEFARNRGHLTVFTAPLESCIFFGHWPRRIHSFTTPCWRLYSSTIRETDAVIAFNVGLRFRSVRLERKDSVCQILNETEENAVTNWISALGVLSHGSADHIVILACNVTHHLPRIILRVFVHRTSKKRQTVYPKGHVFESALQEQPTNHFPLFVG